MAELVAELVVLAVTGAVLLERTLGEGTLQNPH
jgi:hypothetical protein